MDGTSRVSREAQARFREGLGVKFPGLLDRPLKRGSASRQKILGLSRRAEGRRRRRVQRRDTD